MFIKVLLYLDSEVSSVMETTCRKCMVAGNLDCITSFCRLHVHMKKPRNKMKDDVHQKGEVANIR